MWSPRPTWAFGVWSAPWSGASNPTEVGGPRRTVPIKEEVGPTAQGTRFDLAATPLLTLARSRGWHCQRRDAPPSVFTAATATGQRRHGLPFVINTVARSSSSTKPHGLNPYLSPLSLSLISVHDLGCLSKCKENHPLDLHLDGPRIYYTVP
jgi:hypothetical protein